MPTRPENPFYRERTKRGESQAFFASRLGVNVQTIKRAESGEAPEAPPILLVKLNLILGLNPRDIHEEYRAWHQHQMEHGRDEPNERVYGSPAAGCAAV